MTWWVCVVMSPLVNACVSGSRGMTPAVKTSPLAHIACEVIADFAGAPGVRIAMRPPPEALAAAWLNGTLGGFDIVSVHLQTEPATGWQVEVFAENRECTRQIAAAKVLKYLTVLLRSEAL